MSNRPDIERDGNRVETSILIRRRTGDITVEDDGRTRKMMGRGGIILLVMEALQPMHHQEHQIGVFLLVVIGSTILPT